MGIETRHGHLGLPDTDGLAAGIGNADYVQHPVLLDPVTGLPQRHMGGHMDHPQILMGQHHGVLGRVGIVRIDLGMTGIVVSGHIDGLLAQRIGDRGIDLVGHSQLNDLDNILEGRLTAQLSDTQAERLRARRVTGNVALLDESQIVHVDDAVAELCLCHRLDGADLQADAGYLFRHLGGILHAGGVAHHQRTAALIDPFVGQGLDGDLRAVAKGITHGNSKNRKVHHIPTFYN